MSRHSGLFYYSCLHHISSISTTLFIEYDIHRKHPSLRSLVYLHLSSPITICACITLLEFIITSYSAFNTDVIFAVELKRQKKLFFRRKNRPSNQRFKRIGMFILLQSLYKLSLKSVISSPGSFVLMEAVTIAWISLSHSSDLHQPFHNK
jgi:hypothetical protein